MKNLSNRKFKNNTNNTYENEWHFSTMKKDDDTTTTPIRMHSWHKCIMFLTFARFILLFLLTISATFQVSKALQVDNTRR